MFGVIDSILLVMLLMLLLIRFWVSTLPLISFNSSFRLVISDLLTFFPLNLNLESLGYSFRFIFRKTVWPNTFSIEIFTSANNPCSQSFVIALVISSPGILISSPMDNPLIVISVLSFRLLAPVIITPPSSYDFGAE